MSSDSRDAVGLGESAMISELESIGVMSIVDAGGVSLRLRDLQNSPYESRLAEIDSTLAHIERTSLPLLVPLLGNSSPVTIRLSVPASSDVDSGTDRGDLDVWDADLVPRWLGMALEKLVRVDAGNGPLASIADAAVKADREGFARRKNDELAALRNVESDSDERRAEICKAISRVENELFNLGLEGDDSGCPASFPTRWAEEARAAARRSGNKRMASPADMTLRALVAFLHSRGVYSGLVCGGELVRMSPRAPSGMFPHDGGESDRLLSLLTQWAGDRAVALRPPYLLDRFLSVESARPAVVVPLGPEALRLALELHCPIIPTPPEFDIGYIPVQEPFFETPVKTQAPATSRILSLEASGQSGSAVRDRNRSVAALAARVTTASLWRCILIIWFAAWMSATVVRTLIMTVRTMLRLSRTGVNDLTLRLSFRARGVIHSGLTARLRLYGREPRVWVAVAVVVAALGLIAAGILIGSFGRPSANELTSDAAHGPLEGDDADSFQQDVRRELRKIKGEIASIKASSSKDSDSQKRVLESVRRMDEAARTLEGAVDKSKSRIRAIERSTTPFLTPTSPRSKRRQSSGGKPAEVEPTSSGVPTWKKGASAPRSWGAQIASLADDYWAPSGGASFSTSRELVDEFATKNPTDGVVSDLLGGGGSASGSPPFDWNMGEPPGESVSARMDVIAGKIRRQSSMLASLPSDSPIRVGFVSSTFGYRLSPFTGIKTFHKGVDLAANYGSPISAASSGEVIYAGPFGGLGRCVVVSHGYDILTVYGHAAKLLVEAGDHVEIGQIIAKVGSSGASTGPHLHFEVRLAGRAVDPSQFVPFFVKNAGVGGEIIDGGAGEK